MDKKIKIDISMWTIAKFFIFILGLVFLYYIRSVVALVVIVVILIAGFTPFVNNLVNRKIPRILAVTILYLIIFIFIALFAYIIIPPLAEQVALIASNFSYYTTKLQDININYTQYLFQGRDLLTVLSQSLSNSSGGAIKTAMSIFGSAASAITVIVLTFYVLVEQDSIQKFIVTFVPKPQQPHALKIYDKVSAKIGKWLQGQIFLAVLIGISVYLVLTIIGIKYALVLAIIAGVLEIVPIIGPFIAGIVAIIFAYLTGAAWWQIGAIVIGYLAIQQLEAHFLVPKMMGKAVGLSPIIIIIALLIGGELGGILGAILAIPIAAGVAVVMQEWPEIKKIE